jgi:hypothetical protein
MYSAVLRILLLKADHQMEMPHIIRAKVKKAFFSSQNELGIKLVLRTKQAPAGKGTVLTYVRARFRHNNYNHLIFYLSCPSNNLAQIHVLLLYSTVLPVRTRQGLSYELLCPVKVLVFVA